MKICSIFQNFNQIFSVNGAVRLCSWLKPEFMEIGKLTEQTMEEIWNSEKAHYLFDRLSNGDYSVCDEKSCAYLTAGKLPPLVEIDKFPEYPSEIALGYEHVCNYRCSVCPVKHEDNFNKSGVEIEEQRKMIEKNLESVLPRVNKISANGAGELFLSKNILKILANWRPLAPKEECHVYLETNGSLFTEENWKKIENLGQYNVTVVVTVMSFDEHTYQVLSGVKYPISRIENNLRFIKSLREKGIINRLVITTVLQERNFRTLPQWFKRCMEEFGADLARVRPYVPYNCLSPEEQWITDIRGTEHPYHQEYLDILKDPIFKHPKFLDWGVFNPQRHPVPYKKEKFLRDKETKILSSLLEDGSCLTKIENLAQEGKVIVHGAGILGRTLTKCLLERGKAKVNHITDFKQKGEFLNIPIINLNEEFLKNNRGGGYKIAA